jgi:hypothetical protein
MALRKQVHTGLWHQQEGHMNKKGLGLQVPVSRKFFSDFQSLNFCKFNIFVGYSDVVKGCRLWDPTAHKIVTSRDMYMEQSIVVLDRKGRFVCKLIESLYGLKVPRQLYKMLDLFMVSHNFLRSEYSHCVYFERFENGTFMFLVLYVDDMLSMFKISKLEAQLTRMFQMKDLGATKQILGIGVHRDGKNGKLWLSQHKSMEKIPMWFSMNIMKLVNIPIVFHCKLSSSLCPGYKEEKVMSRVSHANSVGRLMFAMKCSNISHA